MNPPPSDPLSDSDLDRLLAARVRHTSPRLEIRWRELRRGWDRPASRSRWHARLLWPALAGAMAAGFLALHRHEAMRPPVPYAELIALDTALEPATPLLDPEARAAVLHLPVSHAR